MLLPQQWKNFMVFFKEKENSNTKKKKNLKHIFNSGKDILFCVFFFLISYRKASFAYIFCKEIIVFTLAVKFILSVQSQQESSDDCNNHMFTGSEYRNCATSFWSKKQGSTHSHNDQTSYKILHSTCSEVSEWGDQMVWKRNDLLKNQ